MFPAYISFMTNKQSTKLSLLGINGWYSSRLQITFISIPPNVIAMLSPPIGSHTKPLTVGGVIWNYSGGRREPGGGKG